MKKIVLFPKRRLNSVARKNDKKEMRLLSKLSDETAILIKVKYMYKTRYGNYYFLTRHGDWYTSFDTSNHYKVMRKEWFYSNQWIRAGVDDALSKIEFDNLMKTKEKFLFLHYNKAALLRANLDVENLLDYFTEVDKLPIVYRLKLGDDNYMSLGDKPNKYGLVHDDEVGRFIGVLEEVYRPGKRIDRVLLALTPELEVKALTKTKLDDGITYKSFKRNGLAMRQSYLYRELSNDECDSDIKKKLNYEYHKANIGLRNIQVNCTRN